MTLTCSMPPELDDSQILAYLDGISDERTAAHLRGCVACHSRARRLERMEVVLHSLLYRVACPSPMELGEYHLGVLPPRQAGAISRHIAECPLCAREIAQLQSFLGDLAPTRTPGVTEQAADGVRVMLARLVNGISGLLSAPQLAPALAGLRGAGLGSAIYESEGVRVILSAQQTAGAMDHWDLLGLLTGAGPAAFSVYLWQDGRLINVAAVDEGGNFVVQDLTSGRYELVLSDSVRDIYIEGLAI